MNRKDSTKEFSPNANKSRIDKFHKLFKSVPEDEFQIDHFSCAFLGDILLQGSLYVSENWFCFHSKLPGRGRLLEIPMEKVISITREKTAIFIPNAIGFQTAEEKYVFGSFISRDSTYKFLVSQWKKSQKLNSEVSLKNNSSISSNISFELSLEQLSAIELENDSMDKVNLLYDDSPDNLNNNKMNSNSGSNQNGIDSSESDLGLCLEFETVNVQDTNKQQNLTNQKLTFAQVDPVVKVSTASVHATVQTRKYTIPYFSQCFDFKKMLEAFITLSVKFQKIPRTNLLLAVCTIMVLFLLLSAMALTYKILLLQARLEAKEIWSSSSKAGLREKMYSQMYILNSESHTATIRQLHSVLKTNLQVLQEISMNLENLKASTDGINKHDAESSCR